MTMKDLVLGYEATKLSYEHGYEDGYTDGYITAVRQMILAEALKENDEDKENEQDI